MKRIIVIALLFLSVLTFICCSSKEVLKDSDVVGKWRCELYGSELVIEFTPDCRFISHTDGTENRYTVENGCIVTYVDGDVNSELAIEANVDGNVLTFGGVEYTKITD